MYWSNDNGENINKYSEMVIDVEWGKYDVMV